jgi:histidinol-phosphate aminotransferase
LSKVGLAALCIGWIEADEGLVRQLDKARQPFNVSATSQAAAAAVIADAWDDVRDHVDEIVRERNRVASALRDLAGVDVAPSHANFLWIATPRPASQVFESLVGRGILVRSFHASGGRLANRLRVTIGTTADNDRFIEALREAVAS